VDWQDAGIGNLALTGHAVTPTGRLQSRSRLPTAAEKDVLNIPIEEEIPVSILSQPYHVQFGDRRMAAGVIVLTRGDQVVLRWNAQSAGRLTLRMNEE